MGFLYQLQHVLPNVKLLFPAISTKQSAKRKPFTDHRGAFYLLQLSSEMSPVLIYHLSFKDNIVIHSLITMGGACLAFIFRGVSSVLTSCCPGMTTDGQTQGGNGDAWLCQMPWLDCLPTSWGVRKSCAHPWKQNIQQKESRVFILMIFFWQLS